MTTMHTLHGKARQFLCSFFAVLLSLCFTAVANGETIGVTTSSSFTASPSSFCPDVPVTITYTGTYVGTPTFAWDFGNATVLSGSGAGPYQISWSLATYPGSKGVSLTLTDDNGSTTSYQWMTMYSPVPITTTASHATSRTSCISKISASNAATYNSWSPTPENNIPSGQSALTFPNAYIQPVANTTYTITGTDLHGCATSGSVTVTMAPTPTTYFTVPASQWCAADGPIQMSITSGSTLGSITNIPSGLFIYTPDLWIMPGYSMMGAYTIYNSISYPPNNNPYGLECPAIATSSNPFTLYPASVITAVNYPNSGQYCSNLSTLQTPYFSGINTGTISFTSSPAGLSLNSTTGAINPSISTPGTYTITVKATSGVCPPASEQVTVKIEQLPIADFSYSAPAYCITGNTPDPTPLFGPGATAGSFSATPNDGIVVSANGVISIPTAASLLSNIYYTNVNQLVYSITNIHYQTAACPKVTSPAVQVTLNRNLIPKPFTFNSSSYRKCNQTPHTAAAQIDPNSFGVWGTFSASPAGMVISSAGVIDIEASAAGTYTVTHAAVQGPGCANVPQPSTVITILPKYTITPNSIVACSGAAFSYPFVTTPSGMNHFSWTVQVTSGSVTGATANSTFLGTTLSQTLTGSGTVTYTVTVNDGFGCLSDATQIVAQVNPIPVVTAISNKSSCTNVALSVPLSSANVPTAAFSWTSSTTSSVTGYTNGSGSTITDLLLNSGAPGVVNYVVSATKSGCTGTTSFTATVNPIPAVSSVVSNANPCPHQSFTYTYPRQSGYTYTPNIPANFSYTTDNTNPAQSVVTIVPDMTTSTIGYTVTNTSTSCSASDSKSITVKSLPVITASPATVCAGSPFNVLISSNDPTATYSWSALSIPASITGLSASGSGNHITGTPEGSGVATYGAYTTGSNGCSSYVPFAVSIMVNENPLPSVSTSPVSPIAVCPGRNVSLQVFTPATPAGFVYGYTPPSGYTLLNQGGSSSSFGATFAAGTTNSAFVVTSSNSTSGCGRTLTIPITINPVPAAPVVALTSNSGCSGTGGTYNINMVSGVSFTASLPSGTYVPSGWCGANGVVQGCSYILGGTGGNLVITATNAYSCTTSTTNVLTVYPLPVLTGVTPPMVCSGGTSNIALSSNLTGTTFSWTASVNSGSPTGFSAGSGSAIQQTLNGNGTVAYKITPTSNHSCIGTDSIIYQTVGTNSVNVNIHSNPTQVTNSSQAHNVIFYADAGNGGSSPVYQWKLNGVNVGTNSSSYFNPNLILAHNGMPSSGDKVQCILTSNIACAVNNPASSPIKSVTCTYCREGIDQEDDNPEVPFSVSAYPNPFSGLITVFIPKPFGEKSLLTITDLHGVEVETLSTTGSQVDMGHTLAAGMYVLKVISASGIRTIKISKL